MRSRRGHQSRKRATQPAPRPPRGWRRPALLGLGFLTLIATIVVLPSVSYADTPITHIDDTALTLAPSAPKAVRPLFTPATPDTALGRQALASRSDRLTTQTKGVASFNLIGLSIRAPQTSTVLIHTHNASGWSAWQPLDFDPQDAPDPSSAEGQRATIVTHGVPVSSPIWVGSADGYEVNAPASATDATVHLARERVTRKRVVGGRAGAATAPELGQPAINSRSTWNARAPKETPALNPTTRLAVVHHSVTANDYAPGDVPGILRSIQAFHMDSRGWNDIAYNFAVDKYGTIWEARGGGITNAVEGGHSLGANFESFGVVTLGDFTSFAPPPAMINSIGRLIGWKLYIHGSDPAATVQYDVGPNPKFPSGAALTLPTIVAHRDVGATGCPGDLLYPHLGEIRTIAQTTYNQLRSTPGWWPGIVTGTNADGRLEQFAIGNDQQVWHAWQTPTGWSGWAPLGGRVSGRLAVGRNADGRLEVFAVGVSSGLWHIWQVSPNAGWSAPSDLGGRWSSTIGAAVTSAPDGHQEVFVVGDRGGVYRIAQVAPNGGWGLVSALGGSHPSNSSIVAGHNADGRIEVFSIADGHDVVHAWQTATGWSGTWSIGGSMASGLSLVRNADGRLELFGVGTGGGVVHAWQVAANSAWSGFAPIGGPTADGSGSAVAMNADHRLEAFTTGSDGRVWHSWQAAPNSGWSPMWPLAVRGVGTPAATSGPGQRLVVTAVDPLSPGRAQSATQVAPNAGWGPTVSIG
jgi:hypothetical protein